MPWVSGIADNVAKDAAAANRMRREEGGGQESEHCGPVEDFVGRLDDQEEQRYWRSLMDCALEEVVRSVSARDFEIFVLRRFVGRKAHEIAQIYHLAPATVRSIDRRVFMVLSRSLGHREGLESASEK